MWTGTKNQTRHCRSSIDFFQKKKHFLVKTLIIKNPLSSQTRSSLVFSPEHALLQTLKRSVRVTPRCCNRTGRVFFTNKTRQSGCATRLIPPAYINIGTFQVSYVSCKLQPVSLSSLVKPSECRPTRCANNPQPCFARHCST